MVCCILKYICVFAVENLCPLPPKGWDTMENKLKMKDGKINFRCKADCCQHTCCGPFAGISSELTNIDGRPFDEIVLTLEDYELICSSGYSDLVEEGVSAVNGKKYYKMALEADGTCKALKNGRCSIYKVSPTLCKAFPFYFDMFSGLCAIDCEGFSDDNWVDIENFKSYIEHAKKMYSFWMDFYTEE